jgi:hypothetical protein
MIQEKNRLLLLVILSLLFLQPQSSHTFNSSSPNNQFSIIHQFDTQETIQGFSSISITQLDEPIIIRRNTHFHFVADKHNWSGNGRPENP